MRITGLDFWQLNFTLAEPYTIAYETVDRATNVFVRLHTDEGLIGHGCAAPDLEVTGESPAEVMETLKGKARPALVGLDPTRPVEVYERLRDELGFRPATLAALDIACWDLCAQARQLPLWRLLGGEKEHIRTSTTIGILGVEETVWRARGWVDKGFTFLKLKGGIDVAEDAHRVLRVREAVDSAVDIAFDANQGYSVEGACAFLKMTHKAGLAFLEQPTPKQNPELLAAIQRHSPIPIMADESLTSLEDAADLVQRHAALLFNIKLMKVGGITPALAIDALAERAGIRTMVGCLDESALGIAAGLHFALGRSNVVYADLDGHFGLVGDPAAGAVECREGILFPRDKAGLGVEMEL